MNIRSPGPLLFHELANLFPMMDTQARQAFRADIADNGVIEKIVMLSGMVLDGRNRYREMVELDLDPPSADYRGDPRFVEFEAVSGGLSPLDWVLSKNLHRRHLNDSQRAMVAASLATYRHGGDRTSDQAADLPVGQAEAGEVMHVSERSVRNAAKVKREGVEGLPEMVEQGDIAVSTAAEIASLPADEQAEIIKSADPKVLSQVIKEKKAEKQAAKKQARDERQKAMGTADLAAGERKFPVILMDPEWPWKGYNRETGMDRSEENHYPTSTIEELKARPVSDLAEKNAVIFCWVRPGMIKQAFEVIEAYGFEVVSEFVWLKDKIGKGFWNRNKHEMLFVATRGSVPCPAQGENWASVIEASRSDHSAKPEAMAELIEAYYPDAPKIELNRRGTPRPGWWAWGNQTEGDDTRGIVRDENGFADASHLPLLERTHYPKAKESRDNGATDPERLPGDSMTGDLSRGFDARLSTAAAERNASDFSAAATAFSKKPRKPKPKAQPMLMIDVEADGIRALACFGDGAIKFYAIEQAEFLAEAGMVDVPVEDAASATEQDARDIAQTLWDAMVQIDASRFIPTTIYQRGRMGPLPVRRVENDLGESA